MYIKINPLVIAGTVKPSDEYFQYAGDVPDGKYLTWDGSSIVVDADKEQSVLDDMVELSKLAILEALDTLPTERVKFDMLMADSEFVERWGATTTLDMNHPLTIAAVAAVSMDVDAVKKQILVLT